MKAVVELQASHNEMKYSWVQWIAFKRSLHTIPMRFHYFTIKSKLPLIACQGKNEMTCKAVILFFILVHFLHFANEQ